jgi:hypothetical protein
MGKRKGFEYQPPSGPSEKRKSIEFQTDFKVERNLEGSAAPAVFGLIFVAAGSFPFLVSLGLIHVKASSVHCPMFVLGSVGLAFISAGLMVFFQGIGFGRFVRFMGVLGLITILAFLTPFAWLALSAPHVDLFPRILIGFFVGVIGIAIVVGSIKTIFFGVMPDGTSYKPISNRTDDYPPG